MNTTKALIFVACGLFLGSCAPRIQATKPTQQSPVVKFDATKLDKIIAEQKVEVAQRGYMTDYKVWKDNPSFTGSWSGEDSARFGYSSYKRPLTNEELNKLRGYIKNEYSKNITSLDKLQLEEFKNGIPFGNAMLIQNVMLQASLQYITPFRDG